MNQYQTAKFVTERFENEAMYARVAGGAREGTVGRIVGVRSKYYSEPEYRLIVSGRRAFWVKGTQVEMTQDNTTRFIENKLTPKYQDTLGRDLELDQTIIFPRMGSNGEAVVMVIGTIKRISDKGALYVRAFKVGNKLGVVDELMRVACPDRALILDKATLTELMLSKMKCN
jgi:hypothetical protein